MKWLFNRFSEPSSYAGVGLIYQALPQLLVNYRDPHAWAGVLAGIAAVIAPERAKAP